MISDYRAAVERLRSGGGAAFVCAASLERLRVGGRALVAGITPVAENEIMLIAASCDQIWYL
jgi:sulfur relay (sulfurtransferase) DsrF/TusC family protein